MTSGAPSIPGIYVGTARFLESVGRRSSRSDTTAGRQPETALQEDWLAARLDSRRRANGAATSGDGSVSILFDGYLTDVVGRSSSISHPAARVLTLFVESGLDFLPRLRGSYTCLILDRKRGQAHLFNDRRGSRPLFCRSDSGSILIGPEVAFLAQASPPLAAIDPVAVVEFLIFASYYDNRTLFPAVEKVPPGSVLTITPDGVSTQRYWELRIEADDRAVSEGDLVEEGLVVFNQAVNRLMQVVHEPFLFLSGGIDSRMVLGALRAARHRIPAVTYGTTEGDDSVIGRTLAEMCGLPFIALPIADDSPQDHFLAAALSADCRAETVDFPSLAGMLQQLAARFGAFFNGDISLLRRAAGDRVEALEYAGCLGLSRANRLVDLLEPEVARSARVSIDRTLAGMVERDRALHPSDLSCGIYYYQRLANRQNAFTAAKLRYLEPAQPWLDEDVIEFLFSVPTAIRARKILVRKMLEVAHADLAAVPFASRDSIPHARDYRALIPTRPLLAAFISREFGEGFDSRLAELFRRGSLGELVGSVVAGSDYPPSVAHWWSRLPGMWRIDARRYAADRVHPVSLLLRLMQLNIYLRSLQTETPVSFSGSAADGP